MRVEYDEPLRQFRIYRNEYDSFYVTLSHDATFQSFRVLDDKTFEVVGQWGDVAVYNADGRMI